MAGPIVTYSDGNTHITNSEAVINGTVYATRNIASVACRTIPRPPTTNGYGLWLAALAAVWAIVLFVRLAIKKPAEEGDSVLQWIGATLMLLVGVAIAWPRKRDPIHALYLTTNAGDIQAFTGSPSQCRNLQDAIRKAISA